MRVPPVSGLALAALVSLALSGCDGRTSGISHAPVTETALEDTSGSAAAVLVDWVLPSCMKREGPGVGYDEAAPRRVLTFELGSVRPGAPRSAVAAFDCVSVDGDPDTCLPTSPDGIEYSVDEQIVGQVDASAGRDGNVELPWGLAWGDPIETSASKICTQSEGGTWFLRETGTTGNTIAISREAYAYAGDATPITIGAFFTNRKLSGLVLSVTGRNEQQSEN